SGAVAQMLSAVDSSVPISVWEMDAARETLQVVDPGAVLNLDMRIVPHREAERLLAEARPALDAILAQAAHGVTLHTCISRREVVLRFRGFPFARWHQGEVFFATAETHGEVTSTNDGRLKKLLYDLELYRNPLASDTRHALYRARPERWLEALV